MVQPELDPTTLEALGYLHDILGAHKNKRVVIVGPTCCGKSTLAQRIPGSVDMDKVLFPLLSDQEKAVVCQETWTPKIGDFMTSLARQRLVVEPGSPVFSTVVLDADVVVQLVISDELLTERAAERGIEPDNALAMRHHIEQQLDHTRGQVYSVWLG